MSAPTTDPSTRPDRAPRRRVTTRVLLVVGGLVCLVVAGVVSAFASGHPDGLEYVAHRLGFADSAQDPVTAGSPLAGYATSGVSDGFLSGGLAGVVGVLVTAVVMAGLVLVLRRLGRSRGRG